MKPTNFAKYLTLFLSEYLTTSRGLSLNTIHSYRDTFKLLINFCITHKKFRVEKLCIEHLDMNLISDFLKWLESNRSCSISTRNQRLAAIHSFFRYLQIQYPDHMLEYQRILALPYKKTSKKVVEYLSVENMQLLLNLPDKKTPKGRRDMTLLCTLYDSGARVQELIDIKIEDVIFGKSCILQLHGKGSKTRRVPLTSATCELIKSYIAENEYTFYNRKFNLFLNNQKTRLTREGVTYILKKYVKIARAINPSLPLNITPHTFRHSKAMHLVHAGVNLIYIRDFLGHVDLRTTEIYAKIDIETKRKSIENACSFLNDINVPDWTNDDNLLGWLKNL